ncbi:hypothetical protein RQP46_008711 [Phenoliferia psychrophenolica]
MNFTVLRDALRHLTSGSSSPTKPPSSIPDRAPSIASSLPADVLSSILDHFDLLERQTLRHTLALVSRHWRAATLDASTFIVSSPREAAGLARFLSDQWFEGVDTSVRRLYLHCAVRGGFREEHTPPFVDLLEEAGTVRELDVTLGIPRRVPFIESKVDGGFPTWPLAHGVGAQLVVGEGPVDDSLGGLGPAIGRLAFLRNLRIATSTRPVGIADLMDIVATLPDLEVLDLSHLDFQSRSRDIPSSWTVPPFNRLRKVHLNVGEGNNHALAFVSWLFQEAPRIRARRSLSVGTVVHAKDVETLVDVVRPFRKLLVELRCTIAARWQDDKVDASAFATLNTLIEMCPSLSTLHISLVAAYYPESIDINRSILDTLVALPTLQTLTLRLQVTPSASDITASDHRLLCIALSFLLATPPHLAMPITLRHLTLHPLPIEAIPAPDSAEHASLTTALLSEAELLLSSTEWTAPKTWSDGLVTTSSLPLDATIHIPAGAESPAVAAEGTSGKKASGGGGGFWGGGKKGEKKVDDGIAWHMRVSRLSEQWQSVHQGLGFEQFWAALAERHCEQEVEYIQTLGSIVTLPNSCYLKVRFLNPTSPLLPDHSNPQLYNLPFPTTNRSFLAHVLVTKTTPPATSETSNPLRSFVIFSLPISDSTPIKEEKGHVRGLYVALEELKEVRNANGGVEIEWRCVSQSTPGGSIPTKLAESYMPSSMASHVPSFFAWMGTKYGDAAAVGEHHAHSKRLSVNGLKRTLSLPKRKASGGSVVEETVGHEATPAVA